MLAFHLPTTVDKEPKKIQNRIDFEFLYLFYPKRCLASAARWKA